MGKNEGEISRHHKARCTSEDIQKQHSHSYHLQDSFYHECVNSTSKSKAHGVERNVGSTTSRQNHIMSAKQ